MQTETEEKRERAAFSFVSIAGYPRISCCDPILTGSCQRYDRVITVLTPPSATSSARQKNDDAQFSATAVCYQRDHPPNANLKMSDDNLGMC